MFFGFFGPTAFTPKTDIPDLSGKTILITGANQGLGKEHLRHLAAYGGGKAKLYMAARSQSKAEAAISELESAVEGAKVHFLELDLTSLESVKKAADTFKRDNGRLDVLVNNAGIMAHPPGLTKEGYEVQFGTNHVGHFLLTKELMPLLEKTAAEPESDVRIINLSSMGHKFVPKGGFDPKLAATDMKEHSTWQRYGQSKLANILFTTELARRYPAITSVAVHPGAVGTSLSGAFRQSYPWVNFFLGWVVNFEPGPDTGSYTQVWATVGQVEGKPDSGSKSPVKVLQGRYYTPVAKLNGDSALAKDQGLAKKLWEWSDEEVQKHGY